MENGLIVVRTVDTNESLNTPRRCSAGHVQSAVEESSKPTSSR
jgi:hypothetical protein